MAQYRVVQIKQTREIGQEGWAIQKSAIGEETHIVSKIYLNKAEAQAEVDRLNFFEAGSG